MTFDWPARYLPKRPLPLPRAFGLALLSIGLATLLRLAVGPWMGANAPFLTYFLAVLFSSVWCGFLPATLAALLGILLGAWLFLPNPFAGPQAWALASFAFLSAVIVVVGSSLSRALQAEMESERRLRAAEADLRTLVSELGHRAKNGLTVVMAIVSQTARGSQTVEACETLINARLGAMAKAQDLILGTGGRPIKFSDLLASVLAPFDWDRFDSEPQLPSLVIGSDVAAALALITHELGTNAVKYGALSNANGRVSLSWDVDETGMGWFAWTEDGGPLVGEQGDKGFGSRLLTSALQNHGGSVDWRIEAGGVRCKAMFPVEDV